MVDIASIIQKTNAYIHFLVGNNEVAAAVILAGLMGSLTFFARAFPRTIINFLVKHATTTMTLNSSTESYYQLLSYLEAEGLSIKSRFINIGNGVYGDKGLIKQIGYGTQVFWYNRVPLKMTVEKEDSDSRQPKEFLHITKLGRDHGLFDDMLEAIKTTKKKDETSFYKYASEYKEYITKQPTRPLDTVILPEVTYNTLLHTLDTFIGKEDWYIKHGIPYQLGIFLYGPPGTGKTTLIRSIASHLERDICFVDNAQDLAHSALKVNDAVLVVEEIDTLGISKRDSDDEEPDVQSNRPVKTESNKSLTVKSEAGPDDPMQDIGKIYGSYALGLILTALDGIISNHGRVIVITSNKGENLDAALMRPGRLDLKLEIGYLDEETFKKTLLKFFPEFDVSNPLAVKDRVAPVDLQNKIILGASPEDLIKEYCV
jgi:chaperone BCS1